MNTRDQSGQYPEITGRPDTLIHVKITRSATTLGTWQTGDLVGAFDQTGRKQ